ncbi:MAG: prepilin-type N-terminal cleavage/methylation domain-containing protein [Planctomycetaceae bacterium]|nr:prepilin-type N-terminal cleavage/methylation domain-containing protein [Planctomycetaceae bacterium]
MIFNGSLESRAVHRRRNRSGFTLIELLVAITILLIVFAMTAGVVSLAINTDRIPSSARTIQASLLGARDRAVRAGRADLNEQPYRGVRFVLDPKYKFGGDTTSSAVTGLVYVGSQDDWTDGQVTITAPRTVVPPAWPASFTSAYLSNARIKIQEGSGAWYRLYDNSGSVELTRDYAGTTGIPFNYVLRLPSEILPNEQPLPLDGNVVINLDRSQIPSNWGTPVIGPYSQANMELNFNPNGSVYGPLAAQGAIYLYLCTVDDFLANTAAHPYGRDPDDPARGETLILKITPQTGQVQSFPLNPVNADPFKFAKQ